MSFHDATIVFDLDGTVADTAPDLIAAAHAVFHAEGFRDAPAEAVKMGVGYGTKRMLNLGLAAIGEKVDEIRLARMADALITYYGQRIAEKTTLFSGFLECAEGLRAQGASLMICTNKPDHLAFKLLDALDIRKLFCAVAGRDTFAFRKPDPRHITLLLESANKSPTRAIMVGDSEADVAAAKAANIPVVAVRFGYASVPADDLGADAVIDHFDDLQAIVAQFLTKL